MATEDGVMCIDFGGKLREGEGIQSMDCLDNPAL
jgi:hypothetical protein